MDPEHDLFVNTEEVDELLGLEESDPFLFQLGEQKVPKPVQLDEASLKE